MPSAPVVVLDDRLLIEELLVGLPRRGRHADLCTTTYWYFRACRAAVAGAGGQLSGPFLGLAGAEQGRAIQSLLELREDISLPDPRATVPLMAEIAIRHPRLNIMNLEAAATARHFGATVWLSEPAAAGVLGEVLTAERIRWRPVPIEAPHHGVAPADAGRNER